MKRLLFPLLSCVLLVSSTWGTANEEEIVRLVRQLGADQFEQREEASRKLAALGQPAVSQRRAGLTQLLL